MASVFIIGNGGNILIDYSIHGSIRSFDVAGIVLYCKDDNIEIPGWKDKLWEVVKEQGLDIDDGRGLHAFVYPLIEEYEVEK